MKEKKAIMNKKVDRRTTTKSFFFSVIPFLKFYKCHESFSFYTYGQDCYAVMYAKYFTKKWEVLISSIKSDLKT